MLLQAGLLSLQGVCWRGLLHLGPATGGSPGVEVVVQIMVVVATNDMWCSCQLSVVMLAMLLQDVGGVTANGDERCCQLQATYLLKACDYTTSSRWWWYHRHTTLLRGSGGGATGGMQSWYESPTTMLPKASEVATIGRWLCYKRHTTVL
jgi:hypothetical protein